VKVYAPLLAGVVCDGVTEGVFTVYRSDYAGGDGGTSPQGMEETHAGLLLAVRSITLSKTY